MDKIAEILARLLSRFVNFKEPPRYLHGKKDSTKEAE
tara:strand:+ start:57 stop:167 length:111 start_codon:yes stop_codon:yes gene_type:complete